MDIDDMNEEAKKEVEGYYEQIKKIEQRESSRDWGKLVEGAILTIGGVFLLLSAGAMFAVSEGIIDGEMWLFLLFFSVAILGAGIFLRMMRVEGVDGIKRILEQ